MVCGLEFGCAASKAEVEVENCRVWDLVLLKCSGAAEGGGAVCKALLVCGHAGGVVNVSGDVINGLGIVCVGGC